MDSTVNRLSCGRDLNIFLYGLTVFQIYIIWGFPDDSDELWDCSSNEGGEVQSDSDSCDDNTSQAKRRDAHLKFELVNKAQKAFADMLDRLQ